jgi:hypothetical protein
MPPKALLRTSNLQEIVMIHRMLAVLSLCALAGALLPACSDDDPGDGGLALDATAATLTANHNTRTALRRAAATLRALGEADVLASLPFSSAVECAGSVDGEMACDETGFNFDFTSDADELADWLADNVFTPANVVEQSSTSVTYQLPPSLLCTLGDDEPPMVEEPGAEAELDSDCIALYTEVPIRLRVRSPREGDLDIELLVGGDNPADFRLYAAELAVDVDLGEVRDAAARLAQASDTDISGLPTMRGRVALSLSELTDSHAVLALSIPSAISVRSSGDVEWALSLGVANPAARLELDGPARRLAGFVSVGAFDASLPTSALFGAEMTCDPTGDCTERPAGRLSAHLAGLSGSTSLAGPTDDLELTGFGLGSDTSWLAVDGQRVISVDLNASSGRLVNMAIAALASGIEVTVTPGFDLRVALDMRHALAYLAEGAPDWLLDEDLAVVLGGAAAPKLAFLSLEGTSFVQVLEGALSLTSRMLGLDLAADAGECLWVDDDSDGALEEDLHPFESLLSGTCPQ